MLHLSFLGCEPARCGNWAARGLEFKRTVGVPHGVRKRRGLNAIFRPPTGFSRDARVRFRRDQTRKSPIPVPPIPDLAGNRGRESPIPDSAEIGNREIPRFPIWPGIGNRGPDWPQIGKSGIPLCVSTSCTILGCAQLDVAFVAAFKLSPSNADLGRPPHFSAA